MSTMIDFNTQFFPAFFKSIMMILATEIGDKTFFIAAVLSMRNDRLAVFTGSILALCFMTILSSMMGMVLPSLISRQYTHIISGFLFLYFGVRLLLDSHKIEGSQCSDELEEVEEELSRRGKRRENNTKEPSQYISKTDSAMDWETIFMQALTLTFVAEWGDRSQIATIALASAKDAIGVNVGAMLGHSVCTGMAVIGGRMLASNISEKTVSLFGGLIFLIFGVHSLMEDA